MFIVLLLEDCCIIVKFCFEAHAMRTKRGKDVKNAYRSVKYLNCILFYLLQFDKDCQLQQ